MRTTLMILVSLTLVLGCKKKDKAEEAPKKDPAKVTAMGPMKGPKGPKTTKVDGPKEKLFKKHKKMYDLITIAGQKCESAFMPKCKELKELKQFVTDLWMNKIKMPREERLEAYVTAINLLNDKNEKTAAFAVSGTINGYVYSHDWIVKDPKALPKKYVLKMLKAVPNLKNDSDMGFIIQDVAQFAPAYGLMDEVFKTAEANLKRNKSLVGYAVENMVKYAGFEVFPYIKKYAENADATLRMSTAKAAKALLDKKLKKAERKEICKWSDSLVPAKFDKKMVKDFYFTTFGYRYMELVLKCHRFKAVKKVKAFAANKDKAFKKAIGKTIKKLQIMKKIRTARKTVKKLKKETTPKKAKANGKKIKKLEKEIANLQKKLDKVK